MNFPEVVVQYMPLHVSNDQHAGQRKREGKEKIEKHGTKRNETKRNEARENWIGRVLRVATIY